MASVLSAKLNELDEKGLEWDDEVILILGILTMTLSLSVIYSLCSLHFTVYYNYKRLKSLTKVVKVYSLE